MIMWKSGKKFTSKSNERITVMKQLIKASYILLLVTFSVCSQATVYSSTYIVTDHLGSPVLATDDNGDTLWREDYRPYGAQLTNEDGDNSVGFTGHKDDKALGVTYMQGRWYHQEMGRFLAIDPVGFVEENPISFNRYAYANNNPFRFIDPDGRDADEVWAALGQENPQARGRDAAKSINDGLSAVGHEIDKQSTDLTNLIPGKLYAKLAAAGIVGLKVTKGANQIGWKALSKERQNAVNSFMTQHGKGADGAKKLLDDIQRNGVPKNLDRQAFESYFRQIQSVGGNKAKTSSSEVFNARLKILEKLLGDS